MLFEGMVSVNVPAVIVWSPNVCTLTALLALLVLYINKQLNEEVSVTEGNTIDAEGVQ